MRRFKVIRCRMKKMVCDIKDSLDKHGHPFSYKAYREVKAGEDGWYPGAYGHENIKVGDILDIEGHLADKAAANPDFEEVFDIEEKPTVKKKKPGRPKKAA